MWGCGSGNTLLIQWGTGDPQLVTYKKINTPVGGAGISTPTIKSVYALLVTCILS